MHKHQSSQNGFTIIELLVAITLFGLMIPALVSGINNLTILNNRAKDLALVSLLAENRTETLRSIGYNSISIGTTDFSSSLPNTLASPKSASYVVTNPSNGIKEIVITISYKDYNRTTTRSYKTIVSELGVGQ